jgi:hypothetical protein
MENLLYNLDRVESSYGSSLITAVIQLDERLGDISAFLNGDPALNDFERTELADRLNKLVELNRNAQMELERQAQQLESLRQHSAQVDADYNPENRYTIRYK